MTIEVELFGSKFVMTEELPTYAAYATNEGPVTLEMIRLITSKDLLETQINRLRRPATLTNFGGTPKESLGTCYTGDALTYRPPSLRKATGPFLRLARRRNKTIWAASP